MIHMQLLLLSHPPLLKKDEPPLLQQQLKSRIIQIIELQPPSLHPQFVAAKSLIGDLHNYFLQ